MCCSKLTRNSLLFAGAFVFSFMSYGEALADEHPNNPCAGKGFTTTKYNDCSHPQMPGDVVARDLAMPLLGAIGHLGMYVGVTDDNVLEVVTTPPVIQKSLFKNFKKKAYWGTKYYVKRDTWQTWGNSAEKAIEAGWKQRFFSPEYTTDPKYVEGKRLIKSTWNSQKREFEMRNISQPAKFRCDTFVVYSYKKGMGVNVGFYAKPLPQTPLNTFNWFPRNNVWYVNITSPCDIGGTRPYPWSLICPPR